MRLLIVEDDPLLGSGLKAGLAQDGYAADWVRTAACAEHALQAECFDLLLLDLGLPERDGISLLKELRSHGMDLPVLILTARDSIADKVVGLDSGADDYLVKPFDLDELTARIRALSRRSHGHAAPVLHAGSLSLDMTRREARLDEVVLSLSPTEYALLERLIARTDQVVPRARLLAATHGWDSGIESNTLEVHIHNLRAKLGKSRIQTVRGVGYQLLSEPTP